MKKVNLIATLTLGFIGFSACGQVQTPSEAVKTAFNQKFPNAKQVSWDMESETEWEAEFKQDGNEYSANFSSDGMWKETEHEIKKSDIPQAVKMTLENEFSEYKIEESEISETAKGTVYEFELENGETSMEVAISKDGKVMKKTMKTEDEEDND